MTVQLFSGGMPSVATQQKGRLKASSIQFGAIQRYTGNLEADDFGNGEDLVADGYIKVVDSSKVGSLHAQDYVEAKTVYVQRDVISDNRHVELIDSDCDGALKAPQGNVMVEGSDKIGSVIAGGFARLTRILKIAGDVVAQGNVLGTEKDITARQVEDAAGNMIAERGNIDFQDGGCQGILKAPKGNVTAYDANVIGGVEAGNDAKLSMIADLGDVTAGNDVTIKDVTLKAGKTIKAGHDVSLTEAEVGDFETEEGAEALPVDCDGKLDLKNVSLGGSMHSGDDTTLDHSFVTGELDTNGHHVVLDDQSTVWGVVVNAAGTAPSTSTLTGRGKRNQPTADTRPEVIVKAGSEVKGDITFTQGEGVVKIQRGASVEGDVIGGEIEYI